MPSVRGADGEWGGERPRSRHIASRPRARERRDARTSSAHRAHDHDARAPRLERARAALARRRRRDARADMDGSFIGSTIYLVSHSDIRYEGVLVNIDPVESTLTLQNGAPTTEREARRARGEGTRERDLRRRDRERSRARERD